MTKINYRRFKREQGCRLKKPCLCCCHRLRCLEAAYDDMVVVLPDGTHTYSRNQARKEGLLDASI